MIEKMLNELENIPPELWAVSVAVFCAFFLYGLYRQQRGGNNNEH
jgi:hypothetical protein